MFKPNHEVFKTYSITISSVCRTNAWMTTNACPTKSAVSASRPSLGQRIASAEEANPTCSSNISHFTMPSIHTQHYAVFH